MLRTFIDQWSWVPSICKTLNPFTGNGDLSKSLDIILVDQTNPKQTKFSFEEDYRFWNTFPAFIFLQGIYLLGDIQGFDINRKIRKAMQMTIEWHSIFFLFQEDIRESYPTKKFTTPNQVILYQKALFTEADHFSEVCFCHMQETHQLFVTANVRVKYGASESRWGNFSLYVLLRKWGMIGVCLRKWWERCCMW